MYSTLSHTMSASAKTWFSKSKYVGKQLWSYDGTSTTRPLLRYHRSMNKYLWFFKGILFSELDNLVVKLEIHSLSYEYLPPSQIPLNYWYGEGTLKTFQMYQLHINDHLQT